MRLHHSLLLVAALTVFQGAANCVEGALILKPLTSFGSSAPGWLAPADATYLQGASVQRGVAYNSANNRLYLVDRNAGLNVRVLDGDTGGLVSSLDMTGVTGGTFAANMVGVGEDGAIYVGNLTTAIDSPFRVYRWANEAAAPTVAFSGTTALTRTGDTFAVIGSGANTRIIASGSGHDRIVVLDTVDGSNYTVTSDNAISGIASGGFRLGLSFIDANTAIGKQTGTATNVADLAGSTGQVFNVLDPSEAPLSYYGPIQLLATVQINSNRVRLYDASDLSQLATNLLDSQNLTTSFVANGNGVGDLSFGVGPNGRLRLYALNTNNGIQAFVVVPEPTTTALLLGLASMMTLGLFRRR